MKTAKLTDRQKSILARVNRCYDNHDGILATISPDVARQLERKGLIRVVCDYDRSIGWNRTVRLKSVEPTVAGREFFAK